jgi:ribosome maturation factor RimP
MMITVDQVRNTVEQQLQGTGHFLVDVEVRPDDKVVVEVDNDRAITLAELAEINRALRSELDAQGIDLELQVSSPGMGRPFKVMRQYRKHIGHLVSVQLLDGHSHEGVLEQVGDDGLALRVQHPSKIKGRPARLDEDLTPFAFSEIRSTKTVITFN